MNGSTASASSSYAPESIVMILANSRACESVIFARDNGPEEEKAIRAGFLAVGLAGLDPRTEDAERLFLCAYRGCSRSEGLTSMLTSATVPDSGRTGLRGWTKRWHDAIGFQREGVAAVIGFEGDVISGKAVQVVQLAFDASSLDQLPSILRIIKRVANAKVLKQHVGQPIDDIDIRPDFVKIGMLVSRVVDDERKRQVINDGIKGRIE